MKVDPPTNVTRSTLSNSFKVITNHNPVAEKTTVCLWIKSGSSHEPLERNGLSHLLEHTLFGQRYGDQKSPIYDAITSKGLKIRAFTTTQDTAYFIDNVDTISIPTCIKLFWDIFSGNLLSTRSMQDAKSDIQKEMISLAADPNERLFNALNSICFPNQTLGRPITGSYDSISTIQLDDLQEFLKCEYLATNSLICGVGKINHERLVECCENFFSSLQAKSHPSLTIPNWGGGIIKVNVNVDIERQKIVASLPFSASQSKDYYSFWLAAFAFNSKDDLGFSKALETQRVNCDQLTVYPEFFSQMGRMQIYFETTNSKTQRDMRAINQQLNLFKALSLEDLSKIVHQIDIKRCLELVRLQDSNIEHLAMSFSNHGLIPSEIPVPQCEDEIANSLKYSFLKLKDGHSNAIAYTENF